MLHERCVSAALHATRPARGTCVFCVLLTFCSHQRASAVWVSQWIQYVFGFKAFLSIEDDTDQPEESVFYQVQSLFGHLMESKLQYYVPENFWKVTQGSVCLWIRDTVIVMRSTSCLQGHDIHERSQVFLHLFLNDTFNQGKSALIKKSATSTYNDATIVCTNQGTPWTLSNTVSCTKSCFLQSLSEKYYNTTAAASAVNSSSPVGLLPNSNTEHHQRNPWIPIQFLLAADLSLVT